MFSRVLNTPLKTLSHFNPMFHLYTPENVRKPKVNNKNIWTKGANLHFHSYCLCFLKNSCSEASKKNSKKEPLVEFAFSKVAVLKFNHSNFPSNCLKLSEKLLRSAAMNHCIKSVRIRGFSGLYFPEFGRNTER